MVDSFALGEEIATLATQVNCATHALLTRIRQFDHAEGWGEQGAKTCAHWLTWRIGLDPATAREKVRVARALGVLSKIDQAFADGKLSYAKVRALTRVTTPDTEENALMVAAAATGAQLERICRRLRHASDTEKEQGNERRFRGRVLGDGLVRLEIVVTSDEADLVVQAVERAQKQMAGEATPRPTAADGSMEVIGSYVAGRSSADESAAATAPSAEIVVHLEPAPTAAEPTLHANLEDGTPVSAETLRRVSCDSGLVAASLGEDGTVLDVGRRTRSIPPAIRRALWIRDRGCRFPGCASTRFLHGHHIQHWLHGGRTSLDNLLFLCSFHHRLVHEGGFTITMTADAQVLVIAPTGRPVSAETPADVVAWTQSVWDDPGLPTMPPP
ncbi:MAG TPA: DUF222 domain-containing protein, partial [Polyangia bacterium]|nr:DUF222 domain-containing protein [Polyangia bacterium]